MLKSVIAIILFIIIILLLVLIASIYKPFPIYNFARYIISNKQINYSMSSEISRVSLQLNNQDTLKKIFKATGFNNQNIFSDVKEKPFIDQISIILTNKPQPLLKIYNPKHISPNFLAFSGNFIIEQSKLNLYIYINPEIIQPKNYSSITNYDKSSTEFELIEQAANRMFLMLIFASRLVDPNSVVFTHEKSIENLILELTGKTYFDKIDGPISIVI